MDKFVPVALDTVDGKAEAVRAADGTMPIRFQGQESCRWRAGAVVLLEQPNLQELGKTYDLEGDDDLFGVTYAWASKGFGGRYLRSIRRR